MVYFKIFTHRKDGLEKNGTKPIIDIWSNVINNEEALFQDSFQDKDIAISLSNPEIIDLYEILALDKVKKP